MKLVPFNEHCVNCDNTKSNWRYDHGSFDAIYGTEAKAETPLYRHPLNAETLLLRTVCFVSGERKPLVNTDTFYGPLSVHINLNWV